MAATNDSNQKKVHFFHENASDYRIYSANGVWGGLTTRGDFLLEFFVETIMPPESITSNIKDDGTAEEAQRKLRISVPEGDAAVRRIHQCGVLLSLEEAERIADFIKEKLSKARESDKGA